MKLYHVCLECSASLEGKPPGTRGPRKFCNKSCAQSHRNRLRVTRTVTPPPPVDGARWVALTQGKFALAVSKKQELSGLSKQLVLSSYQFLTGNLCVKSKIN